MIKSSKEVINIPSEKFDDGILKTYKTNFSNLPITSVKDFREKYENLEKFNQNQSLLSKMRRLLCYFEHLIDIGDFLEFVSEDIWYKLNSKIAIIDTFHYHMIILAISVLEIIVLDYGFKIIIGEIEIELSKVFDTWGESKSWANFKNSNAHAQIKELFEKRLEMKRFCLKNNIAIASKDMVDSTLEKFLKEISEERLSSDLSLNTISSSLRILLKNLYNQYEQEENDDLMRTIDLVMIVMRIGQFFNWDKEKGKPSITFKAFIEDQPKTDFKETKKAVQEIIKEEKKSQENFLSLYKGFRK